MALLIGERATVLFQGDSITDAGRSRTDDTQLGGGYAALIAARFHARHPAAGVRFLSRGISGNRVVDLKQRWEPDCLALKPDWLSILIGINDTWRAFDSHDPTTCESYEADYRTILTQVRQRLPQTRLILCEPFVLPCPPDRVAWRADLDPKIHAMRRLAREFNAILIPFDGLFAAAATRRPPEFWTGDGVHPSLAGHALMAEAWLEAVGA